MTRKASPRSTARPQAAQSVAGEEDPGAALDDAPAATEPRVLLDGLAMVESPRWHDGRLWFPQWGTPQIIALDLDGRSQVVAEGPAGLGHSIGWLPDGRMLVTGHQLTRHEPDGLTLVHADLSRITPHAWSEMTIDGRGNIYVTSIGFHFSEMPERAKDPSRSALGVIALVTADGAARQVAGEIAFPNGMVVTPDNRTLIVAESFTGRLLAFDIADDGSLSGRRVWAEGVAPDGICLDADGAIWTSTPHNECVRVAEGGQILDRIALDRACFATMLGGPDRRTLFIMANRFLGVDHFDAMLAKRSGQVLVVGAPAPGAGWP
ncbi:MAG TPA: SMP-30/gluconolactonase/LRE family protein [Burkholderiaceae bacterium]